MYGAPNSLPVSVKKTLLRKIIHIELLAARATHQGLESSFFCWASWPRLAAQECFFTDTGIIMILARASKPCI